MSRFSRHRPINSGEVSHNLASREPWVTEDQCEHCRRVTLFDRDTCTECGRSNTKKKKSFLPNPVLPFED